MKFIAEPMTDPLMFDPGDTWSLAIQQPGVYRQVIESLHDYCYGRDEGIKIRMLDEDDRLIDLVKSTLIVHDSYTFDASARSIATALTKDLAERSIIEEAMLSSLKHDIMALIGEIDLQSSHNLIHKPDVDLVDIIKMMGVRLAAVEQYRLIDKMYSIIEIARNLLAKHLVIFVNHRCLVNSEEFVGLADFAKHSGQSMLFIDCIDTEPAKSERRMVIDNDFYCYERQF